MSGNSPLSRPQTAPIVSSRCLREAVFVSSSDRKVSRYLPIWSSSPSSSSRGLDALAVHEGAVEAALVLDRRTPRPRSTITACLRETVTSSRKISQSGERPIVVRSPLQREASPRRGRRRSGRPAPALDADSPSASRRRPRLLGREGLVVSDSSPCRGAPRSARSSWRPQGSGSRTPGSRCGSSGVRPGRDGEPFCRRGCSVSRAP